MYLTPWPNGSRLVRPFHPSFLVPRVSVLSRDCSRRPGPCVLGPNETKAEEME